MMRIILFLATNFAIILVLSITTRILGLNSWFTSQGIDYNSLLIFALIVGFTGSIISLLISKPMAKMSTRARVIDPNSPANHQEAWLVETVAQFAQRAGIGMPEVAIYEGAPNAFATGAFKNNALVAVSSGLLQSMSEEEVAAVLGHEIAHVANGDMITMTLIQGVVNTFVIFLARVVGYAIDRTIFKNERDGMGPGFFITVIVLEIIFGVFASMIVAWFSRQREFRADAGAAQLMGTPSSMIKALKRLQQLQEGELPQNIQALGISNSKKLAHLFATHPPLEVRIHALNR